MPPRSRTVTRVVSDTVQRFTIWDNFERHERELRAVGAGDPDIAELRAAAETVAAAETEEQAAAGLNPHLARGLFEIAAPYLCANGWEIAPPTRPAKRWASVAVFKVCGGDVPDDPMAIADCVCAGLWALLTWGQGKHDVVMQLIHGAGRLAEILPDIFDRATAGNVSIADLSADYSTLMGLPGSGHAPKTAAALQAFRRAAADIRTRCCKPSTAGASPATSPPAASSTPPGPSTTPASPTP